jgi:hypothetical protein
MTTPKKTPSLTGYYPAHVEPKDATVTLDLDPTFFALKGYPYQNGPPTNIDQSLTIQFIEFTYYNDRFSPEAKTNKYKPLVENIAALGWKIDPLIVITADARAASHNPSMKLLEDKFKLPMPSIRNTSKNINTIAIQYTITILLHKRRLENHQPLPQIQDSL